MTSSDLGGQYVFLPTATQALLLHAALGEGESAIESWRRWCAMHDLQQIDEGTLRLIPFIWSTLSQTGHDDPVLQRCRGIHRHAWVRHQLRVRWFGDCLDRLAAIGVPVLVLKGLPLAYHYYPFAHARPMLDLDVMLPPSQVARVADMFLRDGWKPMYSHDLHIDLEIGKSLDLISPRGEVCDLHWQISNEFCVPGGEVPFWERSELAEWQGRQVRWPCATHLLLHVCLHGAAWNAISPIRWIADAVMILRHSEKTVDWDHLLDLVDRHRLVLPMRDALSYVATDFAAPVPTAVLATLNAMPVSFAERLEYDKRLSGHDYRTPFGGLPLHWADYRRRRSAATAAGVTHDDFMSYLAWVWRLPNRAALLPYALRRLFRQIP